MSGRREDNNNNINITNELKNNLIEISYLFYIAKIRKNKVRMANYGHIDSP